MHVTEPRGREVVVHGRRGRVLEAGRGPVVVVLASSLVRLTFYRPVALALASGFRVLVVELPGAGAGSRLARPWGAARQAAWVRALLRGQGLVSPIVVGHSDTGAIALRLGASPGLRAPRGGEGTAVRGIVLAGAVGAHEGASIARVWSSRFAEAALEPRLTARIAWHLVANLALHTRSFVTHALHAALADEIAHARRVRVPALLAWGHRDLTMPPSCGRRFAAEMPRARLVLMPGGHDAITTHASAFARALRGWLRSLDGALVRRGRAALRAPNVHLGSGMTAGRYFRKPVALVLGRGRWVERVASALASSGVEAKEARAASTAERSFDHGVSVVVAESSLADGDGEEAQFVRDVAARCPVVLVDDDVDDPERISATVLTALA